MSKLIKFFLLFSTIFILCYNISFATTIDENTDNYENTINTEAVNSTISNNLSDNVDTTSNNTENTSDNSNFNYSGVTSVNQLSNYSEANLELNNILNIILIAIGVLIILFAIAILIRLK